METKARKAFSRFLKTLTILAERGFPIVGIMYSGLVSSDHPHYAMLKFKPKNIQLRVTHDVHQSPWLRLYVDEKIVEIWDLYDHDIEDVADVLAVYCTPLAEVSHAS